MIPREHAREESGRSRSAPAGWCSEHVRRRSTTASSRAAGMEFDEVREYQPGDDVRTIDWNVTARMGEPLRQAVRRGARADGHAAGRRQRLERVRHAARSSSASWRPRSRALLAFAAIRNNDKVGLLSSPTASRCSCRRARAAPRAARDPRDPVAQPAGRGTDIAGALEHLRHVTKRRCVVFLISDFLDAGLRARAAHREPPPRRHRRRARGPARGELPDVGLVELEDAETGERYVVDTERRARARRARPRGGAGAGRSATARCARADVDTIAVSTDRPYTQAILRFFRMRERRA